MNIETRLAALERANRRYRLVLAAIVGSIGLFAVLGLGKNSAPDLVQAHKFELLDSDDHVIARLSNFEGNGSLTTYTADGGKLVEVLQTTAGSGSVVTYNGSGKENLALTQTTGGGGSIRVNNSDGTPVTILGRSNNESGSVSIYNKAKTLIGLFTADTAEAGTMITYDGKGSQTGRVPSG